MALPEKEKKTETHENRHNTICPKPEMQKKKCRNYMNKKRRNIYLHVYSERKKKTQKPKGCKDHAFILLEQTKKKCKLSLAENQKINIECTDTNVKI